MSQYIEVYRKHALMVNQRNLKKVMQEAILCFAIFDLLKKGYFNQVTYIVNLIGASLSEPHNGWSLSWFRMSHVRTVRMIKYGWQAIQVQSWFCTSRVRTVRAIKYDWQAIQVLSWFHTSRIQTVRMIKYDGQAIQCFIRRVCRLWVLRGRWSEWRETETMKRTWQTWKREKLIKKDKQGL